jgi:7-keto-8-aminopelargonate synthetase-like enzyme
MMLVDDAHGAGVLGKMGRGALEHTGVGRRRVIQTITLSKAFGTYGGAIIGSKALRQAVLERSKFFIGHTPLPLPLANSTLRSLRILRTDRSLRERLQENSAFVKTAMTNTTFAAPQSRGPILPIIPTNPANAKRLRNALLKAGIYPPLINYTEREAAPYFRFVISSEHTPGQLSALVKVLQSRA